MDRKYILIGGLAGITAAAIAYITYKTMSEFKEETPPKNSAFVFIKPHANNTKTQQVVSETLRAKGIDIIAEGEFTGEQIDKGMLIDQHYYAIASKATLLKPVEIPVPADKFKEKFGLEWESALEQGLVYNAMDACAYLGVDAAGLDKLWTTADKVKFGGGFYCGCIEVEGKGKIYSFNAFFMEMRSKFVAPGKLQSVPPIAVCPLLVCVLVCMCVL